MRRVRGPSGELAQPRPLRTNSLAVFLNLPMSHGFSDATQALVETRDLIQEPLSAAIDFRLVDRPEDADVVRHRVRTRKRSR